MIASIQRRYFSDKFRNFVDLCVQRNSESRPTAAQLSQHIYLKKMKLNNILSTLQMSVMSDGIVEVKKKLLLQEQTYDSTKSNHNFISINSNVDHSTNTTTNSLNTHQDPESFD